MVETVSKADRVVPVDHPAWLRRGELRHELPKLLLVTLLPVGKPVHGVPARGRGHPGAPPRFAPSSTSQSRSYPRPGSAAPTRPTAGRPVPPGQHAGLGEYGDAMRKDGLALGSASPLAVQYAWSPGSLAGRTPPPHRRNRRGGAHAAVEGELSTIDRDMPVALGVPTGGAACICGPSWSRCRRPSRW